MVIDTKYYVDAAEVAKILSMTNSGASQLFKRGKFSTQIKIGRFWIVDRREVEAFLAWRESGFHYDSHGYSPVAPATDAPDDDDITKKLMSIGRTLSPIRE